MVVRWLVSVGVNGIGRRQRSGHSGLVFARSDRGGEPTPEVLVDLEHAGLLPEQAELTEHIAMSLSSLPLWPPARPGSRGGGRTCPRRSLEHRRQQFVDRVRGSVIFTHRPRYCLIVCLRSQLLWRARGGGSSACRPSARSTRRARQQHGTDRRTSRRADESGTPQRTFRISQWCPRFRQRRREDLSESRLDVGIPIHISEICRSPRRRLPSGSRPARRFTMATPDSA